MSEGAGVVVAVSVAVPVDAAVLLGVYVNVAASAWHRSCRQSNSNAYADVN